METQHKYKQDVDRFMNRIRIAINLRLESDRIINASTIDSRSSQVLSNRIASLRQESDTMLRDVEYTLYELIDKALEVAP